MIVLFGVSNTSDCLRSPHLYIEHGIRKLIKGDTLEMCKEWFNDYDTHCFNANVI